MRPKHPHAAESGVGKHTTRESESAKGCAAGKERVASAHSHELSEDRNLTWRTRAKARLILDFQ
jgi:hypothetical protein